MEAPDGRLESRLEKLVERDELDNVTLCAPSRRCRQEGGIRVQFFHRGKVRVSYAHDDDGQRQGRCVHDRLFGIVDVRDDSIRKDEEDEVVGSILILVRKSSDVTDAGGKVGRSVELDLGKAGAVSCDDAWNTEAVRVGRIEVDVELVGNPAGRR